MLGNCWRSRSVSTLPRREYVFSIHPWRVSKGLELAKSKTPMSFGSSRCSSSTKEESQEEESSTVADSGEATIDPYVAKMHEMRKRDKTWYEPIKKGDEYRPLPRVDGPSPFVERRYKNELQYKSMRKLELPLSTKMPLDGCPETWIYNSNGERLEICSLAPNVFHQDIRIDILHRCVTYEHNCKRGWIWDIVKDRGEVRGSRRKQRPQKGSGRARMCDGRAPQFTKGGKAHGKRPKDWSTDLPRKLYHLGLKVALTARYREGDLFIWDDLRLPRLRKPRDIDWSNVDQHPQLQNLIPIEMLDWNESTRLYQDVERTRQMLRNWGWLKPFLHDKVNDRQTYTLIADAKKGGNIVDILEAMPISQFGWEFLKEEDELEDVVVPSVLMIHHGYVNPEFDESLKRVKGVHLVSADELISVQPVIGMGVTKLLKFKKIVMTVEALRQIEDKISIENEVEKWNYFADLNRVEQNDSLPDAFPEDIYGPAINHQNDENILIKEEKGLKMKSL